MYRYQNNDVIFNLPPICKRMEINFQNHSNCNIPKMCLLKKGPTAGYSAIKMYSIIKGNDLVELGRMC